MSKPSVWRAAGRLVGWLAAAGVALQVFFIVRIALMGFIDPQSTTFQRSEAMRIVGEKGTLPWRQSWQDMDATSPNMQRAVIASEDAGFVDHNGIEWEAIERAWAKNEQAKARAEAASKAVAERLARSQERENRRAARQKREPRDLSKTIAAPRDAKVIGASTITQQLAKNLFLNAERSMLRKAQEIALTYTLEGVLSKERILEIYLNSVEFGEGVFGVEAAAQHHFRKSADKLSPYEAARLAVMLPAPKKFEKTPNSAYLSGRAQRIAGQLGDVELP
jgi:monofunctional glycosyltransferase